jgi:hypothetical protein
MGVRNKQFTMVVADDVRQYGIIRATILGKIKGWCETNEKAKRYEYDGFYWSGHINLNEITEQTGLPLETVKKNLKWLLDNQIVIKGNYNRLKMDRTGWYRPNPTVPIGTIQQSCEEHTIIPVRNNGLVLSGTMEGSCEEQTIPTIPTTIISNIQKPTSTTTIPTTIPPVELSVEDKKQVIPIIKNIKAPEEIIELVLTLVSGGPGFLTNSNKEQLKLNKHYFNRIGVLQPILNLI